MLARSARLPALLDSLSEIRHATAVTSPQRIPCHLHQIRTMRTKGGTNIYSDPLKRDERLLRKLEAQLDNVKSKIRREEAEAAALMKKQARHGAYAGASGSQGVENNNAYFWENVLTQDDRRELALNGIHSLDQLYTVHQEAVAALARIPGRNIDRLTVRHRIAHDMYNSIPEKLNKAGRAKAQEKPSSSFFDGLF